MTKEAHTLTLVKSLTNLVLKITSLPIFWLFVRFAWSSVGGRLILLRLVSQSINQLNESINRAINNSSNRVLYATYRQADSNRRNWRKYVQVSSVLSFMGQGESQWTLGEFCECQFWSNLTFWNLNFSVHHRSSGWRQWKGSGAYCSDRESTGRKRTSVARSSSDRRIGNFCKFYVKITVASVRSV